MSSNYDFSKYTPLDSTGTAYSVFKSAFKNIRFALATSSTYPITEADMANLPGIAYRAFGDVSWWYMLLAFNGIQDQLQEVYPGLILNMPSKSDAIAYLSAQQNTQLTTITI